MSNWTQMDFVAAAYAVTFFILLAMAAFSLASWRRYRADYRRLFERKGGPA